MKENIQHPRPAVAIRCGWGQSALLSKDNVELRPSPPISGCRLPLQYGMLFYKYV